MSLSTFLAVVMYLLVQHDFLLSVPRYSPQFDNLWTQHPQSGHGITNNVLSLKTHFWTIRMTGFDSTAAITDLNSISLPISPISRRVLDESAAEIYMFLLEYNQRQGCASLVHHCRVQLCQRWREEEKTENPRAGREALKCQRLEFI